MYKAICKENQVTLGTGSHTVIVTGWLPIKQVTSLISSEKYAAIGNLYSSARGIDFLVRNLLANPQITELIGLCSTKEDTSSGSVQCLVDFFNNGFDKSETENGVECWKVRSHYKGYIGLDIPEKSLKELRENITFIQFSSKDALPIFFSSNHISSEVLRLPEYYPLQEKVPVIKPGRVYGHVVEGQTIAETWVKIIQLIKSTGTIRTTDYGGYWQELIDLTAVVTDEPDEFFIPEYIPTNREFIDNYLPSMLEDAPYTEGVKYTYGQRLRSWFGRDQIEEVINKLVKEIDSASAVMSLWDSGNNQRRTTSDHQHSGSPCLNHIWARVLPCSGYDGELSLTATFRSNDMFSAWVVNAMGLRALQKHILDEVRSRSCLNLKLAPLITVSQSAHIYDDCWEYGDAVVRKQYKNIVKKELQQYYDPSGNFVIEVDSRFVKCSSKIIVSHLNGNGVLVQKYEGKSALKLIRLIVEENPQIKPSHVGYLGIELARAEMCLQSAEDYIQDRN